MNKPKRQEKKPVFKIAEVKLTYQPKYKPTIKISCPAESESILRSIWDDNLQYIESCYLLLLNRANIVLGYLKLSSGGTAGTVVDTKVILQAAIKSNAHGIIIAHNHPSGNPKPSAEDEVLTMRLKKACKIIDVELLDHIILTKSDYYSFSVEDN